MTEDRYEVTIKFTKWTVPPTTEAWHIQPTPHLTPDAPRCTHKYTRTLCSGYAGSSAPGPAPPTARSRTRAGPPPAPACAFLRATSGAICSRNAHCEAAPRRSARRSLCSPFFIAFHSAAAAALAAALAVALASARAAAASALPWNVFLVISCFRGGGIQ